ncbi:heme-copper oxidase subunit III [Pedobacter sp. L105]|uniref:cytochrome c oxidase subunit 3 n=1 Tax=Pedobacter sp. L105 TaxID=1641871 RepID=UPI00131D5053|nr:heme-copper oxidase subunit III [Pedobacter sp. L105]
MENKLMMKMVIGTEAIFFIALMITYVYFSVTPGFNSASLRLLDIKTTGLFSVLLFLSSFTFWRAEVNFRQGNIQRLKLWMGLTILLGMVFLFGQGQEYWRLLHENFSISKDMFGTNFFTLTGFHSLHVFMGLILLTVILILILLGDFDDPGSTVISTAGIYWHFVDIVWMLVFLLVYVLPVLK